MAPGKRSSPGTFSPVCGAFRSGPSLSAAAAPLSFHTVKGWALGEFNETVGKTVQDVVRGRGKMMGQLFWPHPPLPHCQAPLSTAGPSTGEWHPFSILQPFLRVPNVPCSPDSRWGDDWLSKLQLWETGSWQEAPEAALPALTSHAPGQESDWSSGPIGLEGQISKGNASFLSNLGLGFCSLWSKEEKSELTAGKSTDYDAAHEP